MSQKNMGNQLLIVSAIGHDQTGIVGGLSKAIYDAGCNLLDSRMTVMGGEFTIMLMVSGPWNAVQKLEDQTEHLEQKLGLTIVTRRTENRLQKPDRAPYSVEIVAIDHPGIVYQVAAFWREQKVNIEELTTSQYAAAHTGTPMFCINMVISVPGNVHMGTLREQFAEFCDSLNLDGLLEPLKN